MRSVQCTSLNSKDIPVMSIEQDNYLISEFCCQLVITKIYWLVSNLSVSLIDKTYILFVRFCRTVYELNGKDQFIYHRNFYFEKLLLFEIEFISSYDFHDTFSKLWYKFRLFIHLDLL